MPPTTQQFQIARRYSDAMFGYTQAAINAAFETTSRTLAVWSDISNTINAQTVHSEPTYEWSGAPRRPRTALRVESSPVPPWPNPFDAFAGLFGLEPGRSASPVWGFPQAPSPFAWWSWMPQSAMPATWPWAYGLIASGVPGSVAWPMAEANVALLDAASRTAEAARAPFPSYRSDNGFATAQVWTHPAVMSPLMPASVASAMLWPWARQAA